MADSKPKEDDRSHQYCNVSRKIWNTPRFRGLSPEAQRLFLYIITCPHGNMLGCFILRPGYAIDDLHLENREGFTEPLGELLRERLIGYDYENEIVLDIEHFEKNPLHNPNQVKAAIKKVNELPRTLLFQDLIKRLGKPLYEPLRKRLGERLPKPVSCNLYSVTEGCISDKSEVLTPPVDNSPAPPLEEKPEEQEDDDVNFEEFNPGNGDGKKTLLDNLKQTLDKIGKIYTDQFDQRQIMLFVEANIRNKNPAAILHCLNSLLRAREKIKPIRAYLDAALKVEDGKHNSEEYNQKAQVFKKPLTKGELNSLGEIYAAAAKGKRDAN